MHQDTHSETSATEVSYDPALDETYVASGENEQPQYHDGFPQPPHPPPLPTLADAPEIVENVHPHHPHPPPRAPPSLGFHLQNILRLPFLGTEPPRRKTDDIEAPNTFGQSPSFLSSITSGIQSVTSAFDRFFNRRLVKDTYMATYRYADI